MDKKDLQQIKEVVEKSIAKKIDRTVEIAVKREFDNNLSKGIQREFGKIWENNFSPAFDDVHNRMDKFEDKIDKFDGRLNRVESQMVTKSYLDDKLADLEGGVISKLRKEDQKVNKIIDLLKKHKLVPKEELEELNDLKVFPKITL